MCIVSKPTPIASVFKSAHCQITSNELLTLAYLAKSIDPDLFWETYVYDIAYR